MHEALRQFFAPGGQLDSSSSGYEPRPMQETLAQAVACALQEGHALVAEAGTGTGKTLAYLVPALLLGRRVLISTATKHLQEQILDHDLPLAQAALGRPVHAALMKGRTNYLCELRAETAMAQPQLSERHRQILRRVASWRLSTHTGDRAELDFMEDENGLWRELSANSDQCVGRMCPHYERCWVVQMRRRAQEADVVVVNHHLFFADAGLGVVRRNGPKPAAMALIPACEAVIFDEAHELDDIATQHFGHQISERRIDDLAQDIGRAVGHDPELMARLEGPLAGIRVGGRALFDALPQTPGRALLAQALSVEAMAQLLAPLDGYLEHLGAELTDDADEDIRALARRVTLLHHALAVVLAGTGPGPLSLRLEPLADADAEAAAPIAPAAADPYVRYTEGAVGQRTLAARPVDVSHILAQIFARQPAVFVSATLRMGDSFAHIKRRLGLADARELHVDSPFDYQQQTSLYIAADLPEPDSREFTEAAAARTAALVTASGGGAFVLCTSHRSVAAMCQALRREQVAHVFVQGEAPKAHLVDSFRRCGDGVLVATMGFWRGVDVPGRALRLVVMDKLPFASPFDPLVQARLAQLEADELDPFMHHQLPQAALLLRQGFGRLVRSRDDRGMVAILDRRLVSRRYGPLLVAALPACPRHATLAAALAALERQRQAGS